MMMRMIASGGLPALIDDLRAADTHNPFGYYEFGPAMHARRNMFWTERAEGHAVKVLAGSLPYLPTYRQYRVVLMRRGYPAIARSVREWWGQPPLKDRSEEHAQIQRLALRLESVLAWLRNAAHMEHLTVYYDDVIADPEGAAATVAAFLEYELDQEAMANAVVATLRHWRSEPSLP